MQEQSATVITGGGMVLQDCGSGLVTVQYYSHMQSTNGGRAGL